MGTGYSDELRARRPRNWDSITGKGKKFFSYIQRQDRLWDPPRLLPKKVLGIKRPVREADHSPVSSAEAKITTATLHKIHAKIYLFFVYLKMSGITPLAPNYLMI
jgi:hypothetical protein